MIYRVKHENHYTTVRNKTVRDGRLSFKATGLLVYLLSLPDDTRFSREDLAQVKTDGVRAVRSALRELTAAGYLQRERIREGRRLVTVTTVRERPVTDDPSGGALWTSTRQTSTKRTSNRRNKEGARPAKRGTPPEPPCHVCGDHPGEWYTRDGVGFCDAHRAEFHLHGLSLEETP